MNPSYILSFLETLGLGIFFFYLIRGLKLKISSLEQTVSIQNQTLDVMEKRIKETEKVGDIYRNLMSDLPQDLDNFKAIMSKTKDETILELKNQQEITKNKLEEAQQQIKKSNQNPDLIKQHLKVLKNLLSKPKHDEFHVKFEYELVKICEYGNFTLEQCVPLLIISKTLHEFLSKLGFDISLTEDQSMMGMVFKESKPRKSPKGVPIEFAISSYSVTGGWHLIVNNEFYLNQVRLSELKDEFNAIKTIV